VDNNSLDVVQILVVLESLIVSFVILRLRLLAYPLYQTSLFSEVRNPRSIIVRKHLITQDRIRHLGRMHQVHLQ
jgi:hypothetical protein